MEPNTGKGPSSRSCAGRLFPYRVQDRKLIVVPEEASIVRQIFDCYLEQGSILKLLEALRHKGIKTKRKVRSDGSASGGIPFTTGPVTHLLKNRIYIGQIHHHGQMYPGEHEAIVDEAIFEAVQARLAQNLQKHRAKRAASNALLLGKLFDDAGNRMTPSTTKKGGLIHRYYISRALLEGRKHECGSYPRISADQIETLVVNTVKTWVAKHTPDKAGSKNPRSMLEVIQRVVVGKGTLEIALICDDGESDVVQVPWTLRPGKPKREVLEPAPGMDGDQRPMRSEVRSILIRAIALGRLWLKEITTGKAKDIDEIATREDRSKRSVYMTISLAFLAPDIVEAAIKGALPRRIGITRLTALPPNWKKQREMLGLRQPS